MREITRAGSCDSTAAIVAISLPIYWLREPTRQDESSSYFDENQVERGAVLYARPGMPNYNPARSLQCAGCHGVNIDIGIAEFFGKRLRETNNGRFSSRIGADAR